LVFAHQIGFIAQHPLGTTPKKIFTSYSGKGHPMKENRFSRRSARSFFIGLASMLLAVIALVISVNYQYPENPSCRGMLGAGFPVLFICDDWGGGSPTNSWGKITIVDIFNGGIKPGGFLEDFLFYAILFYIITRLVLGIYQRVMINRTHV
jgi:hypothetical protein